MLGASRALMVAYAERWGLDLVVLREAQVRVRLAKRHPRHRLSYEKLQLGRLLELYERLLYVDGDILIHPAAPDIFASVPETALGCVRDDVGPDAWKRQAEMERAQRKLGRLEGELPPYFNAGVMVLSQAHRELFAASRPPLRRGRWPEQTYFNYQAARLGLKRAYLDPRFNWLPQHHPEWAQRREVRQQGYFIHYAGQPTKGLLWGDWWGLAALRKGGLSVG